MYIYIYTCSVIIYNFDLPGAALQARQSSVQILSIPLRCWTWRFSFKCAIFLGGEVLTIKENSIPKCIFICGSFQSHIRARIKTMWLLHSAIPIQLNVVYSALYLCLGCSRNLERFGPIFNVNPVLMICSKGGPDLTLCSSSGFNIEHFQKKHRTIFTQSLTLNFLGTVQAFNLLLSFSGSKIEYCHDKFWIQLT